MSKRVRGPVRARRPGARPANERPASARRRPVESQLEAAEVIAEDVVEERPADAAHEIEAATRTATRTRVRPGGALAVKAAVEYVYVAQDMRRILLVAAALFGTLLVLWLILIVFRVVALPFY